MRKKIGKIKTKKTQSLKAQNDAPKSKLARGEKKQSKSKRREASAHGKEGRKERQTPARRAGNAHRDGFRGVFERGDEGSFRARNRPERAE
jgi:hypothetical protein